MVFSFGGQNEIGCRIVALNADAGRPHHEQFPRPFRGMRLRGFRCILRSPAGARFSGAAKTK
jgi:hypothetical protein